MRLRLHLDPEGNGWYFDIDFELDYEDNGPGYFLYHDGIGRDWFNEARPWEAIVLCVKSNNSQAPLKPKCRKKL